MTLAFSYTRFSSAQQEDGDSLRRQIEKAEAYAKQHNLTLDTATYRDLGVSAFKGKNVEEGMLGEFLAAVRKGKIPKGSYLLIEALDRLSRMEPMDADQVFKDIVNLGITIVTLEDGAILNRDALQANMGLMMLTLVKIYGAHEYSKRLSMRVTEAYAAKRARGEKITTKGPAWLIWNPAKANWDIDEQKAAVVRSIFKMAIDGYGQVGIVRKLNADHVPTMVRAKEWTQGVVGALLRAPTVYGRYDRKRGGTETIEGYYPAILPPETFFAARAAITKRILERKSAPKSRVARTASVPKVERVGAGNNLFRGIVYCLICGARCKFQTVSGGYAYLRCATAYSDPTKCPAVTFSYRMAETGVLRWLERDVYRTAFREFASDDTEAQLAAIDGQIASLRADEERLIDWGLQSGSAAIGERLKALTQQIRSLESTKQTIRRAPMDQAEYDDTRRFLRRYEGMGEGKERDELRIRMRAAILRLIRKVEVVACLQTMPKATKAGIFKQAKSDTQTVAVGAEYLLRVTWNPRGTVRYMDLTDLENGRQSVRRVAREQAGT